MSSGSSQPAVKIECKECGQVYMRSYEPAVCEYCGNSGLRVNDEPLLRTSGTTNVMPQGWPLNIDRTPSSYWNSAREPVSEGRKDDKEKLPIHLLPTDALECITEILAFGAKKYAPRNWEKGMQWSRVYRACIGHLWKWWRGAPADEETGKSHLWHAGCCILFLIAYEHRKIGSDDRPETERISST